MRMQRMAIWILVLVLAIPTVAIANGSAGPVSVDTPNDQPGGLLNVPVGASGQMEARIQVRAQVPVVKGTLTCDPAGETGKAVAARFVDALCANAELNDFICVGSKNPFPGVPCGPAPLPNCCNGFTTPADSVGITCTIGTMGNFTLFRQANDFTFDVSEAGASPSGGTAAVTSSTNCGNTIGEDLWPWVIVQLLPNGVNGDVTYTVYHEQGGANPRSFSVDTGDYSTSKALHDAIAAGFISLDLDLNVVSVDGPNARGFSPLLEPSDGFFVAIRNAKIKVTEIQSRALQGQSSEIQTLDTWAIPTLSEWGMIFVVALLLATGYWMLRRRKQATRST